MHLTVVGNGPCLLNGDHGAVIDKSSLVCRFNIWEPGPRAGHKIDWWIINSSPDVVSRAIEPVVAAPRVIYLPGHTHPARDAVARPRLKVLGHRLHVWGTLPSELASCGKYTSSTGTNFLYYVMIRTKWTADVYGFNLLVDGKKGHYFEDHRGGIHLPKHERLLLDPFVSEGRLRVVA